MGDYDYRPGTRGNHGVEYEDQMITYLAVAACNQKDLKDFWIARNVDGVGAWDDIAIFTETVTGEKNVRLIQLKHKENPNFVYTIVDVLRYKEEVRKIFYLMSRNYEIQPNQRKINELLNDTGVQFKDVELIFMTNAKFENQPHLLRNVNGTKQKITIKKLPSQNSFIKTNTDGPVYKITSRMSNRNHFALSFLIYSQQSGVVNANNCEELSKNIENELKKIVSIKDSEIYSEIANNLKSELKEWFVVNEKTLNLVKAKELITECISSTLRNADRKRVWFKCRIGPCLCACLRKSHAIKIEL